MALQRLTSAASPMGGLCSTINAARGMNDGGATADPSVAASPAADCPPGNGGSEALTDTAAQAAVGQAQAETVESIDANNNTDQRGAATSGEGVANAGIPMARDDDAAQGLALGFWQRRRFAC